MSGNIGAIFFDLDGTLLDSIDDVADTTNAALAAQGFPTHPAKAYCFFIGDGIENMLRRAAPEGTDEVMIMHLVDQARAAYDKQWANKTTPYDGILPMLDKLQALPVTLAVLSNKPHDFTVAMIEHFFPHVPFAKVQGSPKGSKAKPDPTLALQMAKDLNVTPEQVLFMGDSRTDMDTAVAAGMLPAGALWGFRPESELVAHGAQVLLAEPEDVFKYL